jgi:hypothetical protein
VKKVGIVEGPDGHVYNVYWDENTKNVEIDTKQGGWMSIGGGASSAMEAIRMAEDYMRVYGTSL